MDPFECLDATNYLCQPSRQRLGSVLTKVNLNGDEREEGENRDQDHVETVVIACKRQNRERQVLTPSFPRLFRLTVLRKKKYA